MSNSTNVCPDARYATGGFMLTRHCTHALSHQHAIHVPGGRHRDSKCCWCGEVFCENLVDVFGGSGHGPHAAVDPPFNPHALHAQKRQPGDL